MSRPAARPADRVRRVAQDPPTLPQPTDPVSIGRSEFTGKGYGTVDFGGRITPIDGDEARAQRYRDLRSGLYANNAIVGRRTQDWTFEAQAWNIGLSRPDATSSTSRASAGCPPRSCTIRSRSSSARDTRTLYDNETQPGVFRLDDSMQQSIQAGPTTLHS